jgi:Zn-dependent protease with chaperone function
VRPVRGEYYDGCSSRRQPAELHLAGGGAYVRSGTEELVPETSLARVAISARLGSTPRRLRFPDGSVFETSEHDALERALPRPGTLLHRLESRARYVVLAMAVVVLFGWGMLRYGVPAAADALALALPASASTHIGYGTLELLDATLLSPTELDEATREHLAQRFAPLLASASGDIELRVLFRSARDTLGANALALPSGTVIFTDELVQLAEAEEELLAVLAHELGHIEHRHGLRRAIRSSALGVMALMLLGDASALHSIIATLPVLLTELGYSREFEREADDYALQMMRAHGIDPSHFAAILMRLAGLAECRSAACAPGDDGAAPAALAYLSTHPRTEERVRRMLEPAPR